MNFKKVVALSICAAMVAGMSASTVMAADLPDQFKDLKANEAYEFPMMVKSFQSTYWDAAQEGMKKAAEELGVTYTAQGPNSESDIADQVNMINTAIASNPKGLGLAACDTSSVLDALNDCVSKGIPVVTFDTGIADAPEGSIACEVCTDNAQAGSVAAENMYNAIKDVVANAEGQVVIGEVNQDATAQNIQQRGGGFIDKMIELLQADGKTVAVAGNEFYVNAAKNADAKKLFISIRIPFPRRHHEKNIRTFKNKSLFNGNDLCSAFSGTFQRCLYPSLCCCKKKSYTGSGMASYTDAHNFRR